MYYVLHMFPLYVVGYIGKTDSSTHVILRKGVFGV